MFDSVILAFCQYRNRMEYTELEGCYYPQNFTTWEEYAKETKLLMCREFYLDDYPGDYKQRVQYEKMYCPEGYVVS